MKLSLIVRGQHPPGDPVQAFARRSRPCPRPPRLGFDGIVKGSHYSAQPFESAPADSVPVLLRGDRAASCGSFAGWCWCRCTSRSIWRNSWRRSICSAAASSCSAPASATVRSSSRRSACRAAHSARVSRSVSSRPPAVDRGLRDMQGVRFRTATMPPVRSNRCRNQRRRSGSVPTPTSRSGAPPGLAIAGTSTHTTRWRRSSGRWNCYKRSLDEYGRPFPAEVPMRREVFVASTRAEAIRLRAALSGGEVQSLSCLGSGQGHARRRRFQPCVR